ncbi:MAG: hypothetical protein JWP87_2187, partial [Labilithrix sp.]|nr:hypothetical protein [Labilithrix sp.]
MTSPTAPATPGTLAFADELLAFAPTVDPRVGEVFVVVADALRSKKRTWTLAALAAIAGARETSPKLRGRIAWEPVFGSVDNEDIPRLAPAHERAGTALLRRAADVPLARSVALALTRGGEEVTTLLRVACGLKTRGGAYDSALYTAVVGPAVT